MYNEFHVFFKLNYIGVLVHNVYLKLKIFLLQV